jgi:hypothetical protein
LTEETNLQRMRSGGRMFGAVLLGLVGLGFGLAIIGFTIHATIGFFAQGPVLFAAVVYLAVVGCFALLGGSIAYFALRIPIRLWRDRRTPLPVIDGAAIVIARKRPSRLWPTLGYGVAGVLMPLPLLTRLDAVGEMGPSPIVYLPFALMILGFLVGFVRVWFPPRLYWEPIVLDGEGIDDRSLGRTKIPWRDVQEVSLGALAAGNGTLLKLTEPPKRLPGVTILATGFLPLLDRMFQGRRYVIVRTQGLALHHERTFRLIHAYWRYGNRVNAPVISRTTR